MAESVSLFGAFLFGLISFVSPCILPLIPAYISYISGVSIEQLKDDSGLSGWKRFLVLVNAFAFVLGFSVVFVLLGATATFIGSFLTAKASIIMKIGGIIIVIFGLHMTGVIRIPFLYYEKKLTVNTKVASFFSIMLMGAAFAFGWTPCVGPILATILAYAATQQSVVKGIVLLSSYSLGLAIPFLLTAVAVSAFFRIFAKLKKAFRAIEIVGGILLILTGVLVFLGSLRILAGFFMQIFPFLGNIG